MRPQASKRLVVQANYVVAVSGLCKISDKSSFLISILFSEYILVYDLKVLYNVVKVVFVLSSIEKI